MVAGLGAIISSAMQKAISTQQPLPAEPIPPELCSCCLLQARKQFSMSLPVLTGTATGHMAVWLSMPTGTFTALPRAAGPTVREPSIGYLQKAVADGQRKSSTTSAPPARTEPPLRLG